MDVCGIIEADLHSATSRTFRRQPLQTSSLLDNLEIPGFTILLPRTWDLHGQARLVLFVRQGLRYKIILTPDYCTDLPVVTLTASKGGERPSTFSFVYREYTGGVTDSGCSDSQKERLARLVKWWKSLEASQDDPNILGDINLDWFKGCSPQYNLAIVV